MKKFLKEFKDFALRGNVLDMAIGLIIATAFTDIVKSLTANFIDPILKFVMAGARYEWTDIGRFASNFMVSVINFVIIAFVLFCIVKVVAKAMSLGKKKSEAPAPVTKICPFCKTEINIEATRCPNCTSVLEEINA